MKQFTTSVRSRSSGPLSNFKRRWFTRSTSALSLGNPNARSATLVTRILNPDVQLCDIDDVPSESGRLVPSLVPSYLTHLLVSFY